MNEEEENRDHDELEDVVDSPTLSFWKLCDATSYRNFLSAFFLMVIGLVITILAVFDYATDGLYSPPGDKLGPLQFFMVLVGPILINVGATITVKTVVYLRRTYLVRNAARNQALIRVLAHGCHRNDANRSSIDTLPPPYDSVVHTSTIDPPNYTTSLLNQFQSANEGTANEPPPPSYEDAVEAVQHMRLSPLVNEEKVDIRV